MSNLEKELQPFHSVKFGLNHNEKVLEDWLEGNPQVLTDEEPLLVIGRQVNTPVGVIDLLALDSSGAAVIVELKKLPDQRSAISQALEYASWLSNQETKTIHQIAEDYFKKSGKSTPLTSAWKSTFTSELPQLSPNEQHRIFIVIEGEDERITLMAKYLRNAGVDISLLIYNYYRVKGDEEFLEINKIVGNEKSPPPIPSTESELLETWEGEVKEAYLVFRDRMASEGLTSKVKRTQVSFRKQTRDEKVFICGYHGSGHDFKIWFRTDTLQTKFNFKEVAETITKALPKDVEVIHTDVWFILTFSANVQNAKKAADLVISEIVKRIV